MEMILVIALAVGSPAPADGIRVSPGEALAGQRIHITVPDCAVGPTTHTATSDAFTRRVTLHGKADTGEADAVIRNGLAPGTYRITASCGTSTQLGQVVVPGHPPTPREGGSNAPYWALAGMLAAGATLFIVRRRRR